MKRQIMLAETQADYNFVGGMFAEGWVLEPTLTDGKPYRLDNATVWPLVLYEEGDAKPITEKIGEFDDVEDLKDVPNSDVSELLKQGYKIQTIYQKNTILVKRGRENEVLD